MIAAFGLALMVCSALAALQKHPALSDEPGERGIAVVTAATMLVYLPLFALSCVGARWPYAAALAALVALALLLARRLRRVGAWRPTPGQAFGLLGFLLVGLVFFGTVFSFGTRYVMDNVDTMAHIATGQHFLREGRIAVDTPFRYPPLTSVLLGILMGALPRVPQFLVCQLLSILLLLGIALAARQLVRRMTGRAAFGTDVLIVTVAFTSMPMYALISGFTSLLAGIFFLLATLLGLFWHRAARSPLSLTAAALPVLAVSCSYYLFLPVAFATWCLCLPDFPPDAGWRERLRELTRPGTAVKALLVLAAAAGLVFFYVPGGATGLGSYLEGYGQGLSEGVGHLTVTGGSLLDLRLCAVALPLLLLGLARARRRSPRLVSAVALAALAFGAAQGLHAAGRMSAYYFSKMAALCHAYSIIGLGAGLAAVRAWHRPLAAALLLVLVGAGAVPVLGARTQLFAETSLVGGIAFRLARMISPFSVANAHRLRREPLLSRADEEAARYIGANASSVLDAGTGRLTAAGAGVPLYFYERNRGIPLVFLLLGNGGDVYQAYFHGSRTFEQWLAEPAATHLLVVDTGGDTGPLTARARAAGLTSVFERGNVSIFSK